MQKDNMCYYASSGEAVNETIAESHCGQMNASLVTISSPELNSFLTNVTYVHSLVRCVGLLSMRKNGIICEN